MRLHLRIAVVLLLAASATAQTRVSLAPKAKAGPTKNVNAAAADISGMYSFLSEGEFVQITLEPEDVSGYISRKGDLESDRGAFLDQFFDTASVKDHDVTFSTKPLHGVRFEFKGRFDRGPAKTRQQDGYYVIRGTLTEYLPATNGKDASSRSRQVEFKLLAQPVADDKEKS
ncbi:MAG TPA: hypothetical protein VJN64_15920 [Terriglobales bacterium]|nr:hypothetical protein [Terriglobales bacterium]